MSKKSISEALADIQRKVNEQRMKNAESNWNAIQERNGSAGPKDWFRLGKSGLDPENQKTYGGTSSSPEAQTTNPGAGFVRSGFYSASDPGQAPRNSGVAQKEPVTPTQQAYHNQQNSTPAAQAAAAAPDSKPAAPAPAPKPAGTSGATMPSSVPGAGATASGFGISGPTSSAGAVSSAPKPAAKPAAPMPTRRPADLAPQAQSTPVAAAPVDPNATSKAMFSAATGDNDTPGNFFAANSQRQKEMGGKAPNDFSSEEESGGKTKVKKSMKESALISAALGLIGQENMFEAAKKMKGTCSSCGKMPCQCSGDVKEELKGNQKKIDANHNGKVDAQDFKILRGKKKMEEESSSDPDMAAPRPGGEKKKGDIEFKPQEAPKSPIEAPKDAPMPPKKPAGLKENIGFSEAELAHIASIMEADAPAKAPVDGNKNYKVNAKGNEVGTGPTAGDLSDETIIDEARGRPKGSSKADVNPNNEHGRDPRQHIQVIAGQAAAGRVMDFKHENGEVSKISPGMGRRIGAHLDSLKPAEKQAAVLKMHKHAEGLKV